MAFAPKSEFAALDSDAVRPSKSGATMPRISRGVAYGVQRSHAGWQSGLTRKKYLPAVKG